MLTSMPIYMYDTFEDYASPLVNSTTSSKWNYEARTTGNPGYTPSATIDNNGRLHINVRATNNNPATVDAKVRTTQSFANMVCEFTIENHTFGNGSGGSTAWVKVTDGTTEVILDTLDGAGGGHTIYYTRHYRLTFTSNSVTVKKCYLDSSGEHTTTNTYNLSALSNFYILFHANASIGNAQVENDIWVYYITNNQFI